MFDMAAMQDFHFVRPWWFMGLIPAWLLGWALAYRSHSQTSWHHFIDPVLLAPLLNGRINKPGHTLFFMISLFWTLAIIALAGPTWQQHPQPVKKLDNALVILLDLSPSMLAADIKPARVVAARHKIIDLLHLRKEGYTALIAYSGDAHIVAPLTDDNETIINLMNVLEPAIMPIKGSNVEHAIEKALQLFANSGYNHGDILLITDGVTEQAVRNSSALLSNNNFRLSIIGIGTEAGGPIPASRGGFIKDDKGNILMPELNSNYLRKLANDVNGSYTPLQLSDKDILPLAHGGHRPDKTGTITVERKFDQWQDMGALLTLPLLILALFAFRRGIFLGLLCLTTLLPATSVEANNDLWERLWLNDNQRAMKAIQQKDYEKASKLFTDEDWKASAQYQNKNYTSALKHFEKSISSSGYYNKGNSLAKNGGIKEAIKAYDEALKLENDFEDAKFNKKILEEILKNHENQNRNNTNQTNDNKKTERKSDESKRPEDKDNKLDEKNKLQETNSQKSISEENKENEQDYEDNRTEAEDSSRSDSEYPVENHDSTYFKKETPNKEEQQAMEQWLRKVPDDPSLLLRNKFEYYYQQQLRQQQRHSTSYLINEDRW